MDTARTGTEPFSAPSPPRRSGTSTLVGFSVTYGGDYINVLRLLRMAGIPARARGSQAGRPSGAYGRGLRLLEPRTRQRPFMDVIAVEEGEELVGEIIRLVLREPFVPTARRRCGRR